MVMQSYSKITIFLLLLVSFSCVALSGPDVLFAGEKPNLQKEKMTDMPSDFYIEEPERKDPFIAGLLSWTWTGLGQFYTQEYAYGSLFLFADLMQKGFLLYMIFYYSDKYKTQDDDIVKWQNLTKRDRGVLIGYFASIFIVKVLCVINAVESAQTYNRNIYFPYWKTRQSVKITMDTDDHKGKRINIGLNKFLRF